MINQPPQIAPVVRIAMAMLIAGITLIFMYYARPVLLPLAFAGIIALLLYPLCRFFENNGFPRIPAALLAMLIVFCFFSGLILLLSTQIYKFVRDLPDIADKVDSMLNDLEWFLFKNFNIQ